MAVAQVSKINIISHQKHQEDILEVLQNTGFAQVTENTLKDLAKKNLTEQAAQVDYQLAGIKFSLDFLNNFETAKKSLKEKIDPKINLSLSEIETTIKNFDYQTKVKTIQELEAKINNTKSFEDKIKAELSQIEPWQKLSFVPNRKKIPAGFNFKLIILPETSYLTLINALTARLPLSAVETVEGTKTEVKAAIFFKTQEESILNEILNELAVKIGELPELEITVADRIKAINRQAEAAELEIAEQNRQAQNLAGNQRELKIAFDYLTWQKEKTTSATLAGNTQQTFSLFGWIDKQSISTLKKELDKVTNDYLIEELPIAEDESVPIIFKNTWASAFETVTNIYGAPQYSEPDPTPWLAPFFILFFGLCLTDAGYGIVLTLLSWLGLKFLKPTEGMAKMMKVLFWGGLVTFFAGAAVGGWFGIIIDDIGNDSIRNFLTSIRIVDPVKEPIKMLIFSLILGVIQVIVGIIVNMWWKIKHHDVKSALLDDAMWLYFIFAILIGGAAKLGLIEFAFSKYLIWAGVIGMVITQGRRQKNPALKLASGVLSLYGLVGYLSDVLSYSRLLALGLATGIIAMVVNLIAKLTIDMIPYLGWVIAIVVIIGGHIFNLGINALGAFIHSSRLQFVEFFPKFMEGGGQMFVPFCKEGKFVRIINKNN